MKYIIVNKEDYDFYKIYQKYFIDFILNGVETESSGGNRGTNAQNRWKLYMVVQTTPTHK